MANIARVAASYQERGMLVQVLSAHRALVTDPTGSIYRVTSAGRVITGKALEDEIKAEEEARIKAVPKWLRLAGAVKTNRSV